MTASTPRFLPSTHGIVLLAPFASTEVSDEHRRRAVPDSTDPCNGCFLFTVGFTRHQGRSVVSGQPEPELLRLHHANGRNLSFKLFEHAMNQFPSSGPQSTDGWEAGWRGSCAHRPCRTLSVSCSFASEIRVEGGKLSAQRCEFRERR